MTTDSVTDSVPVIDVLGDAPKTVDAARKVPYWRRLGGGSLTVSIIIHAGVLLLGAIWVVATIPPPPEKKVDFNPGGAGSPASASAQPVQRKVINKTLSRVSAIGASSPLALPEPDLQADTSLGSLGNLGDLSAAVGMGGRGGSGGGTGLGSGGGIGDGVGAGMGRGVMLLTDFGMRDESRVGLLAGQIWDTKRRRDGSPGGFNPGDVGTYIEPMKKVLKILERDGELEEADIFAVGEKQYLNVLVVPDQPADNAAKAFGAEGQMEPMGFFIDYSGKIRAPRNGRFRFVGRADNLMFVLVDDRVVLNGSFDDCYSISDWKPDEDAPSNHPANQDRLPLIYGDWINAREGQVLDLHVLLGESTGGKLAGVLLVEYAGDPYQTGDNGRPILPPFTLASLIPEERERLTKQSYPLELDQVPFFGNQTGPRPLLP